MEAIIIAGVAVVVAGGYYSTLDLLADLGIQAKTARSANRNSSLFGKCVLPSQRRVKKVAGVNI